jgi:hypothetical protein
MRLRRRSGYFFGNGDFRAFAHEREVRIDDVGDLILERLSMVTTSMSPGSA